MTNKIERIVMISTSLIKHWQQNNENNLWNLIRIDPQTQPACQLMKKDLLKQSQANNFWGIIKYILVEGCACSS